MLGSSFIAKVKYGNSYFILMTVIWKINDTTFAKILHMFLHRNMCINTHVCMYIP